MNEISHQPKTNTFKADEKINSKDAQTQRKIVVGTSTATNPTEQYFNSTMNCLRFSAQSFKQLSPTEVENYLDRRRLQEVDFMRALDRENDDVRAQEEEAQCVVNFQSCQFTPPSHPLPSFRFFFFFLTILLLYFK